MDPAIKEKWVKALRSGAYRQGSEAFRLRSPQFGIEYCCLGVLCEISGSEWKEGIGPHINGECLVGCPGDEGFGSLGLSYFGLNDATQRELISMNDGFGDECTRKSFPEIADYIEKNL